MTKWKIKKTAKEDWEVLRRKADDTEDGKEYYYISGPKGIYQDDDGNTYKFDTREEALEEVEYLKAEHKYEDKIIKKKANFNDYINEEIALDLKIESTHLIEKLNNLIELCENSKLTLINNNDIENIDVLCDNVKRLLKIIIK